eukprot:gnl/TRDRNA2_/TRDRNA2_177958_c0_seq1.p1 gnl/TRDRNA2_/TRDRNA2_177958_c0~~gnl/TRDRNA2_/TRDRNA2_177958_c0_seq1.p1  ORF type:complete len:272 (+),score=-27.27 gnl/TRDRNA2_/TRDRNA2_177958_c0_seq1:623-1438(+)
MSQIILSPNSKIYLLHLVRKILYRYKKKNANVNYYTKYEESKFYIKQASICAFFSTIVYRINRINNIQKRGFKSNGCMPCTNRVSKEIRLPEVPNSKKKLYLNKVSKYHRSRAFVKIITNIGDLNIELYADTVPQICENFLLISDSGYLENTVFSRSIKHSIIQGGDFHAKIISKKKLNHTIIDEKHCKQSFYNEHGIISMANFGSDLSHFKFSILFKHATHPDYNHKAFGRVVGGFENLSLIEQIPTNLDENPLQEIKIIEIKSYSKCDY